MEENKTLTVIVGAGASYDCGDETNSTFYCNRDWRPPLTHEIFSLRSAFDGVLAKYPKAGLVAAELREKTIRLGDDISLEKFLKEYSENKKLLFKKNFRQIPFYLQELLGEVSQHYIGPAGSSMYERLITYIEKSDYARVLFLSLNYDLFLDKALQKNYDRTFNNMDDYVSKDQNWLYVKLHGSVNWGQKILSLKHEDNFSKEDTSLLVSRSEVFETAPEIIILNGHQESARLRSTATDGFERFYPCIAVPVEGKYPQTCPSQHINAMRDFLTECTDFLVVGCRVNDKDLLDHLKVVSAPRRICFVNGNRKSGADAFENLVRNTNFGKYVWHGDTFLDFGFRNFIVNGHAEKFLGIRSA